MERNRDERPFIDIPKIIPIERPKIRPRRKVIRPLRDRPFAPLRLLPKAA